MALLTLGTPKLDSNMLVLVFFSGLSFCKCKANINLCLSQSWQKAYRQSCSQSHFLSWPSGSIAKMGQHQSSKSIWFGLSKFSREDRRTGRNIADHCGNHWIRTEYMEKAFIRGMSLRKGLAASRPTIPPHRQGFGVHANYSFKGRKSLCSVANFSVFFFLREESCNSHAIRKGAQLCNGIFGMLDDMCRCTTHIYSKMQLSTTKVWTKDGPFMLVIAVHQILSSREEQKKNRVVFYKRIYSKKTGIRLMYLFFIQSLPWNLPNTIQENWSAIAVPKNPKYFKCTELIITRLGWPQASVVFFKGFFLKKDLPIFILRSPHIRKKVTRMSASITQIICVVSQNKIICTRTKKWLHVNILLYRYTIILMKLLYDAFRIFHMNFLIDLSKKNLKNWRALCTPADWCTMYLNLHYR